MARLVLILGIALAVVAGAALLISAVGRVLGLKAATDSAPPAEDPMPSTFRTIAYIALFLLMLGVVTGVVGGA